ncbi:hypothetical protein [Dactylosporangium sp. NPDC051541]|uniref:hypothetical protein n=1 Tax=Dactylosporangium sp. NPDC051541 TaxID=3363977 RepID=UPI00378C6FA5
MATVRWVLRRSAVAALHVTVWLALLLVAPAVGPRWLLLLGAVYALVTCLILVEIADGDGGRRGVVRGVLAMLASGALGLGFPSWYVQQHGTDTPAVVTAHRCLDTDRTRCGPQYRVTAAASERDLGWTVCTSGHLDDGALVMVRTDPLHRLPAVMQGCGAPTMPSVIIAVSAAIGGLTLTLTSFNVRRRPARPS